MIEPQTYQLKPVTVEAMRWQPGGEGSGVTPILDWINAEANLNQGPIARYTNAPKHVPTIGRGLKTVYDRIEFTANDAVGYAEPGDWIIRDPNGFYTAITHEAFTNLYTPTQGA